jgi:glutamine amidotransferase
VVAPVNNRMLAQIHHSKLNKIMIKYDIDIDIIPSDPFVFGRHAFMHNGVISDFDPIKRDLAALIGYSAYCNIRGSTDSEHAAALYMTYLTNDGPKECWEDEYPLKQMLAALHKTVTTIMETQRATLGLEMRPNSLNFCVTDGVKMIAIRFRNHKAQEPPSL